MQPLTNQPAFRDQRPPHLVHVSPMSMMVAVAVWSSPPPQHSPMLGHRASSHTVAWGRTLNCLRIACITCV